MEKVGVKIKDLPLFEKHKAYILKIEEKDISVLKGINDPTGFLSNYTMFAEAKNLTVENGRITKLISRTGLVFVYKYNEDGILIQRDDDKFEVVKKTNGYELVGNINNIDVFHFHYDNRNKLQKVFTEDEYKAIHHYDYEKRIVKKTVNWSNTATFEVFYGETMIVVKDSSRTYIITKEDDILLIAEMSSPDLKTIIKI
jgi:hypothetical protein